MIYHFSEESDIQVFEPRKSDSKPDHPPMVWAISEQRMINYLFPRDCPRIIFSRHAGMSEEDLKLFFSHTTSNTIITVENGWYEQLKNTRLYKYTFDDLDFELIDEVAGYYITHRTVKPIRIEPIEHLMDEILKLGADLRFTPNLHPLKENLLNSTINDFSIIRFRNAKQP